LGEMAYAMLMIDGCGLTRMCSYMAELLDQPENTLRQKYREMYYEKEAKAGVKKRQQKRREIVVDEHLADLLRAVITRWQGVKKGLTFRAPRETAFGKVGERVKRPGQEWKGKGEWSEQGERMEGTLVVGWEEGYEEPICVVTDLAPEKAKTAWYQLRFWIEC